MKYTIHLNQLVLAKTRLDIIDAGILDYIGGLCSSTSPRVEKERISENEFRWTWLNLDTVCREMPLLRLDSPSPISRRIIKIAEEGYIETIRKENRRLFVRLTPKYDELLFQSNSPQAQAIAVEQQYYPSTATNHNISDKTITDKEANHLSSALNHNHTNGSLVSLQPKAAVSANRLADALWLRAIPQPEMAYFREKFPQLTDEQICSQAENAYLWLEDNPSKKRSGKKLFLKNWLDRFVNYQQQKGGRVFHEYK